MLVILARHGNTFAPGEPVVWVGGRTNLPLVEKGRAQAVAIGEAMRETGLLPRRAIAGPLQRTRETATLALAAAGLDPGSIEIDQRLREIDYGRWEAKSSEEIRAMGDGAQLAAWEERCEWPASAEWPGSRDMYGASLFDVMTGLTGSDRDCAALIVSSNGIFRLAARSLASSEQLPKVATGAMSLLSLHGDTIDVAIWNAQPAIFVERYRQAMRRPGP